MKYLFTAFLLSLVFGAQILSAQTVKIGSTTYPTIPDAITAAVDGDIIEITGVHTGNFSIVDKSITLRGTDPEFDILQAAASQAEATGRVIYINNSSATTLPGINVTIENLGIRYGNASADGGGIFADRLKGTDPLKGKVTLRNLMIEQNSTSTNSGGGIAVEGSDVDIISCTITGNTAFNGGGLLISGLLNSAVSLNVYLENSTISNNNATSGSGAGGGGGVLSLAATTDNVTLKMVHVTMYNNDHTGTTARNGIAFGTTAGSVTNFSLYNSIIVTADVLTESAIIFAQSNTTEVINCILGGLTSPNTTFLDTPSRNNVRGRTATQAGIATALTDEVGKVKVLALTSASNAADYCTATTGITLPTEDARGQTRDLKPDAGAFEVPNVVPGVSNIILDQAINTGTASLDIDLSNTFNDADGDNLILTALSGNENIITTSITGSILTITVVNPGTTTVTVTADDGKGGTVNAQFSVIVNAPPVVSAAIADQSKFPDFVSYTIDLTNVFSDPNSDQLNIVEASGDENVVTVAINGATLTITEVGTGSTTITLTATDGKGGSVIDEFSISVQNNNVPTVANAIEDKLYQVGFSSATFDIAGTFADTDQDGLSLSVAVGNQNIVTIELSGTNLTIAQVGTGSTTITVTANDGNGGSVSDEFTVTVNATPAVSAPTNDQVLYTGFATKEINLVNVFSDLNSDALMLSATVENTSIVTASISGNTLTLAEGGIGSTSITVTANDGKGGTVSDQFSVSVAVNNAPTVANAIADKLYQVGFAPDVISISNTFADADQDVLSLTVSVNNTNLVTAAVNGTNLTITGVATGIATVTLTASDGKGGSVSDVFTVNVNSPPMVSVAITDKTLINGFATSTVDLTSVFSDANSDALTLSVSVANTSIATAAIAGTTLTLTEVGTGSTNITVTANDSKGGTVSDVFQVTVNATPAVGETVKIGTTFYPTITDALNAAADGDIIEIRGTHTEKITITDKSITLRGADPTLDIIQAAASQIDATGRVINILNSLPASLPGINVTIENLGIRYGNVTGANGGGIFADKLKGTDPAKGKIILRNLIIEQNKTSTNGGGVAVAGSDIDIIECTIINNTATASGGGVIVAANGVVNSDIKINIIRSLIDSNMATTNGGGLYVNGTPNAGFIIDANIENSTISNNVANSGSSGAGGGGIWSQSANTGNVKLKMVHVTMYKNDHTGTPTRNGISFGTNTSQLTRLSIYNSIIVSADDLLEKALNFANSNTTAIVNSILGGLENAPALLDDANLPVDNNKKGQTATFAGIATDLTNEGGKVKVLALSSTSNAKDYCSVPIAGITLPTVDARGATRDILPDAGAFEDKSNSSPIVTNPVADQFINFASSTLELDLANTFSDANGDNLSLTTVVESENIALASVMGNKLTITVVALGTTNITVTANDGNGGTVSDVFSVSVQNNNPPTIASAIEDKLYQAGFAQTTFDIAGTFTDADNEALTLSTSVDNQNVITASINGTSLTLTEVGVGSATVTVTANDVNGASVSDVFTVTINGAPAIATPISDITLLKGFGTSVVNLINVFSDPNGDVLVLSASSGNENIVTATISGTTLTLTETGVGTGTITLTANDGKGGSVSDQFQVTINDEPVSAVQEIKIGQTTYATINEALSAAVDGDIIDIRGTYTERLTIEKSVTLRGADPLLDKIQAAQTSGTATGGVITIAKPTGSTTAINVTIENLGIRHGNAPSGINGGGIFADKLSGKVTLRNLIIEQNRSANNGGGVALAGSDADIIDCTIISNTATNNGGGIIAATNNAAGMNNKVNIIRCLIDGNTASNGGGLFINGNPGAPNTYSMETYIENSTISHNIANSGGSAAGGGGVLALAATSDNLTLTMVYVTMFSNDHAGTASRNGVAFGTTSGNVTNFNIYNSIIVNADDVVEKAINFVNSNPTTIVNSILGGLENTPALLDDANLLVDNNKKGQTATFAGLATTLTDEGGKVKVLTLISGKAAVDYCTVVPAGITLPTVDATGKPRDINPDAGAFEYVMQNALPTVSIEVPDQFININNLSEQIDLSATFSDIDGDNLSLTAVVANTGILTVSITGTVLTFTPVAFGTTTVTVTADDGKGGTVSDVFTVSIQNNNGPKVANSIADKIYQTGFSNALIDLSTTFTDSDGDVLTLAVSVSNQNVIQASLSGTNLTITEVGLGSATVTISANDGNGATVSDVFILTVNAVPVVSNAIKDQELIKGFGTSTLDLANVFSDPNGDALKLSVAVANPEVINASITGTTLTFTETGVGKTTITVTADDGKGGSISDEFSVMLFIVVAAEDETSAISIYPNPAASYIRINASSVMEVIIMNVKGIKNTYEVNNGEVDISALSDGVYMLYISSLNKRIRFIKQ